MIQQSFVMEISTYPQKFSDDITVEISADAEDHCIIVVANHLGYILRMMGGMKMGLGRTEIQVYTMFMRWSLAPISSA